MADDSAHLLLTVTDLHKSFRGVHALHGYRLELRQGDLLGVIGPNGAGKTTLFNLLTGLVKPTKGRITLGDADITGMRPEAVARRGIARTFQKIRLFQSLTALENVRVSAQIHEKASLGRVLLSSPGFTRRERAVTDRSRALLARVGIGDVAGETVNRLSYNQQRRLELACALGLSPKFLLLDEPTAGMNPTETAAMIELVQDLQREHRPAIVLIEHNMQVIMNTAAISKRQSA